MPSCAQPKSPSTISLPSASPPASPLTPLTRRSLTPPTTTNSSIFTNSSPNSFVSSTISQGINESKPTEAQIRFSIAEKLRDQAYRQIKAEYTARGLTPPKRILVALRTSRNRISKPQKR